MKASTTFKNFEDWLDSAIVEKSENDTYYIMQKGNYQELLEVDNLNPNGWLLKESCFDLNIEKVELVFDKLSDAMSMERDSKWSLMEEGYPELNINR